MLLNNVAIYVIIFAKKLAGQLKYLRRDNEIFLSGHSKQKEKIKITLTLISNPSPPLAHTRLKKKKKIMSENEGDIESSRDEEGGTKCIRTYLG